MRIVNTSYKFFVLSLIFINAQSAFSEQIIIRDCTTFIRATSIIPEDSTASIVFTHKPGAALSIKESKTNNSAPIQASKNNETESVFTNIKSGDWTACGGDFDKVDLSINDKGNSNGVSLLAAGTGVLAGASVIAFGSQGRSENGSIADSLSEGTDPENVAAASSAQATNSASASSEAASRCLNDSNIADMSQSD